MRHKKNKDIPFRVVIPSFSSICYHHNQNKNFNEVSSRNSRKVMRSKWSNFWVSKLAKKKKKKTVEVEH